VTRRWVFNAMWFLVNTLLPVSFLLFSWGLVNESSARAYLKGFVDAVVPLNGSPQQKVEAILAWMSHPPARLDSPPLEIAESYRNPVDDLSYSELLEHCGTSASILIAAADRLGIKARRLLLLDENNDVVHVTTQLLIDGRWVVVDAAHRTFMRDAHGRLLTKEELRVPQTFQEAVSNIPGDNPICRFDRTAHVHIDGIPLVGRLLRRVLDRVDPGWDDSLFLSQVVSRTSLAQVVLSLPLLIFCIAARAALGWYGAKRWGIRRVRLQDRLARAAKALFFPSA
jgi:hypothetical protein